MRCILAFLLSLTVAASAQVPLTGAGLPTPVAGAALAMSYTPVQTATQGVAYTGATPSTSGGTAPYVYSMHAGTLPHLITLDTGTGILSGTPDTVETQTGLVLRVTDNVSATVDSSSFQIAVSAAPYVGPGDLSFGAATAWFGFRCYTAAYSGSVADIVDAATGNTTGTRLKCDGAGNVVATVSASACTFVTGNACSAIATTCAVACNVVTLYDQTAANNCTSATCNVTQATNSNRPTFLYQSASCGTNANLSCMSCPAAPSASPLLSATALSSTAQTFYSSAVVYTASAVAAQFFYSIGSGTYAYINGLTTKVIAHSSTDTTGVTFSLSAWHAVQVDYAGASSVVTVDNSSTGSLNAGAVSASGKFNLCSGFSGANPFLGYIAEYGMWPSTSTFVDATIYTNQHNFYGGF